MHNQTIPEISEENKAQDCDSDQSVVLAGEELEMNVGDRPENATKAAIITKSIEDAVVDELNKHHATVRTNQFHILTERANEKFPKQKDWFLESKESFFNQYANTKIKCSDDKTRTKAQIWFTHPRRRAFDNGVTFNMESTDHLEGRYNIWKGFSVKPKQGSCELYKAHIQENICNNDTEKFNYVWNWMASLIQKPQEIGTALLLMGSQGTGKGVFVKHLGYLLGKHFCHLDNLHHVLGHFNNHLKDSVLVFCDEAIWGGNKKDIGRLKAMVTEDKKMVEQKGKDALLMPNFSHFIFASNEDWPIHVDVDDRRLSVQKVGEAHKEDYEYFAKIDQEMKEGGYEALLYELLHVNLGEFRLQKIPQNSDSFSVKLKSMSSSARYIYESLKEGCFDIGNALPQVNWTKQLPKTTVYYDYVAWCAQFHLPQEDTGNFGETLFKLIPSAKEIRPRDKGTRPRSYIFLELDVVRRDFQKICKVGPKIWDDDS